MRPTLLVFCLVASSALAGRLTLVLDMDRSGSNLELAPSTRLELTNELNNLFRPANLDINVKLKQELTSGETFSDVVVVRLQGTCRMVTMPPVFDERGPYAWAHTVDGRVLPFVEVKCDNIRRSVGEALWTGQRKIVDRDRLFGRALARILAHEVVHIKSDTAKHGESGVFRHALRASDLVSDQAEIHADDLERMPTVAR